MGIFGKAINYSDKSSIYAFHTGVKKMFCKISAFLLVALLFVSAPLLGQNTNATSTDIDVLLARSNAIHLGLTKNSYFMADNRIGSLVTAWSTNATADSIYRYCGGQDRYWVVSVESWVAADSSTVLRIDEYALGSTQILHTYRGNIGWHRKAVTHAEANVGSTPLGLNLQVCAASAIAPLSAATRSTWRWYIYLTQSVKEVSNALGSKPSYSLPYLDSLTIVKVSSVAADPKDTLAVADSSITTAIPGQFGFLILFVKCDTISRFKLGYQIKQNGSTEWCGPLSLYGTGWFSINDSLVVGTNEKAIMPSTTTAADSLRFRILNLTTAGRCLLNHVKALWRD
jgi:hypothetical protein